MSTPFSATKTLISQAQAAFQDHNIMDNLAVLIVASILGLWAASANGQTVPINCSTFPNHTLCLNSTTSACTSLTPPGPTISGIDVDTRNLIIGLHNALRQVVGLGGEARGNPGPQPPSNPVLGNLAWNPTLANIAQTWANQCKFQTDVFRNIGLDGTATSTPVYVGQNAYGRLDYASTIPANPGALRSFVRLAISTWYNEVATFNSSTVSNYQYQPQNGKYTQMVWANTTDIGCGYVQWNYPQAPANRIARILFCDYGPGGNLVGQPVYFT